MIKIINFFIRFFMTYWEFSKECPYRNMWNGFVTCYFGYFIAIYIRDWENISRFDCILTFTCAALFALGETVRVFLTSWSNTRDYCICVK